MRKARLLLLAICTCSIMGGAYAYKVQRTSAIIYIRAPNTTLCLLTRQGYSTVAQVAGQIGFSFLTATTIVGTCTIIIEIYTAP